ncbi:MAG: hypothetical protein ACI4WM_01965 [Erysipelotrichaceae bacterium]
MNFLFYAMIILLVVMTINNARKMKSFGNERGFIDVYGKVLDGQSGAREELENYLNTNQIEYLNSKAMLVKIYDDLRNDIDYTEDVEKLNIKPLFTSNGQFSRDMFSKNCDAFIWLSMIYAIAYKKDKKVAAEIIDQKVKTMSDKFVSFLEYHLYLGYVASLNNNKNDDYRFLQNLIDGEYNNLIYEKKLIGLYKREAAIFLFKNNDLKDEFWLQDLKHFKETKIGSHLIEDLNLSEKVDQIKGPEAIASDEEDKQCD